MTPRLALTVKEVAELLGKKPVQVQRWLLKGELPGTKIGGSWFIPTDALAERLRAYDAEHAGPKRGDAVPAEPGQAVGGAGDDVRRPPAVRVRKVEGRGRKAARGAEAAAKRTGAGGSRSATPWQVPRTVAD